ncbi:hypothetical protein EJB05_18094 [Eragrostis curvula]|uniref:F-box domain-containing protein n=1 Tax=Eragrostis curvula TaxID=38414 RepID=A0A5J9VL39_9POAL|nr:hypothetical protein EJB05_18094 [Eragrostis curvula]
MGGSPPTSPRGSNFFLNDNVTKVTMDASRTGGTPAASPTRSGFSLSDEFVKVTIGSGTGPSWSDLPIDILLSVLQRLELPQAIAFASVCKTWRTAATIAGIPHICTPWVISWANHLEKKEAQGKCRILAVTCNSHHLDVKNKYDISFPQSCFVACCGASHGWLVLVNGLSNLVLYNPFTMKMIPLPPITDFAGVEAIYGSGGNLEYYRMKKFGKLYDANCLGISFYAKAVLSCSPSKRRDYAVMVIHRDGSWLSFVKAGESKWQVASTGAGRVGDRYLDCAYHDGSFYAVTYYGLVEKWHIDEPSGPRREEMVSSKPPGSILTRHMVSTPWGDLLQVCGIFALDYPDGIRFKICKVGTDGCKVSEDILVDHALFLGLNHSACLPTQRLPGIQPNNIYFSRTWMPHAFDLLLLLRNWGGVRKYDLKRRKFECAFFNIKELNHFEYPPCDVWIAQNMY